MGVFYVFNGRRLWFLALALLLSGASSLIAGSNVIDNEFAFDSARPAFNLQGGGGTDSAYLTYQVRYGDTLALIAAYYNVDLAMLMRVNGLRNPNLIYAGQILRIPRRSPPAPSLPQVPPATRDGPDEKLMPDSEAVYSPAYIDFDVNAVAQKYQGYLASYQENVEGQMLSGAQIVQLIAERFSVGPRVLLTVLEMQGGWLTERTPNSMPLAYPMGYIYPAREGLYKQLWWSANFLNEGYYGQLIGRRPLTQFIDRSVVRYPSSLNPGTAAVHNLFAHQTTYGSWLNLIGPNGFQATYQKLFGDPFAHAIEPLVPPDVKQPTLRLPFEDGQLWFVTGGPHGAWADGSAWAAIDFAPEGAGGCWATPAWTVAAASGKVVQAEHGRVMINLDGANFQGSGWTLMYMHMATRGRVAVGAELQVGERIGHPSCEGGYATGNHLHFARMYNGQWISVADTRAPFVLSGWLIQHSTREYDGTMTRGGEVHEAFNGQIVRINGVMGDSGPAVAELSLDK